MKKKLLTIAMTAFCFVSLHTTEVEAGRSYRSSRTRARAAHSHVGRRVSRYPRALQRDGRSLWDLGKQNGQWPTF